MREPPRWEASSEGFEELQLTETSYFQLETKQVEVLQRNEIKTFRFIFIRNNLHLYKTKNLHINM